MLVLGDPVVGVGRLRLADERRRSRGGRRPAGDLRRDGGVAGGRAVRADASFGDGAAVFAGAYAIVRFAQIGLFVLASRDDPALRRSVLGLAVSTAIGVRADRARPRSPTARCRARCGCSRSLLDMGGPLLLRHRGLGARPAPLRRAPRPDRPDRARRVDRRDRRRRASTASTPAWSTAAVVGDRRWPPRCGGCTSTSSRSSPRGDWRTPPPGRERNEIARDSFSYLHLPMVAGHRAASRSASRRRSRHVERPAPGRPRRRAARRRARSTCSPTWPSAGATCIASASQRRSAPRLLSRCSRSPSRVPALVALGLLAARARRARRLRARALRRAARPPAERSFTSV